MKKIITILLLTSSFFYSQTASLSVSGKVENQSGYGEPSHITVNQLVGNQLEERGQIDTDSLGFFNLSLNNITSIKEESSTNSVVNFVLNNNSLYSPINTKAEIIYYTILGETLSSEIINLSLGCNELKPIENKFTSGIYIRRINLSSGIITQKIIKNASQLSYGTSGNFVLEGFSKAVQLNKTTSDSLYLITIATSNCYLPDTIFTTLNKYNIKDITGLNFVLKEDYSHTLLVAYLTIATLKDSYFVDEQINLTDPPDAIKSKVVENFNEDVLIKKPKEIKSFKQIESSKSDKINKLIESSQNKFELRLSIPSHFPEYLQKPQKFFSGRTFKIVYADGSEFNEYPKNIQLSKREANPNLLISDNLIEVDKLRSTYFAFVIPEETKSGFYTIEFEIENENFMLPVQIVGLTPSEIAEINSVPISTTLDERIVLNKQLNCKYCFWESVLKINPENENYGYFVGGGAKDNFVQTTDGWESSTTLKINVQTSDLQKYFRGDPKLTFDEENKLIISSLLWKYPEVITGGIFVEKELMSNPITFTQSYIFPIPPNIPANRGIIFDYEKIAIDTDTNSEFYGNKYISAGAITIDGVAETGLITLRPNGTTTVKHTKDVGMFYPPNSMIMGSNGKIFAGRDKKVWKIFYGSYDGGETFKKQIIYRRNSDDNNCYGRVSTTSDKAWFIYRGVDLAYDKNSERLYAAWVDFDTCVPDANFEYTSYAFDHDVFVSYSDDDGMTWSEGVKVNDDNSGGDQGFPSITLDDDGVVYVAFLDHRDNQDLAQFDVYVSASYNNGKSFSENIKVNDISVSNVFGHRDPGDYLDMIQVGENKIYVSYPCMNLNYDTHGRPNDACISVLNKPLGSDDLTGERPQSKIVNLGDEDLYGRLTMSIQKNYGDETSEEWRNYLIVTDEMVTVPANGLIKLDVGEPYGWNLKNVSISEQGKYRVFAKFVTPKGSTCNTYQFEVIDSL